MNQNGFAYFADALVFVHGPMALAEAARHAELCERAGDKKNAGRWRRTMAHVKAARTASTQPKQSLAA